MMGLSHLVLFFFLPLATSGTPACTTGVFVLQLEERKLSKGHPWIKNLFMYN